MNPTPPIVPLQRLSTMRHRRWTMAGGRHAGIVSEPGHPRRSYQMDHQPEGGGWVEPDDWLAQAPLYDGSWWPAMHAWLKDHSGTPVPAQTVDASRALGDAPGEYVKVRYAD